jgi:hypothetical protein
MTRSAKALLLFVALVPAWAQAQMIKCVDARGVTHYTDKPQPGCKGKEVDIRASPPISGKVQERKSSTAQEDASFRQRQIERESTQARDAAGRKAQEQQCARTRDELARLTSANRVSIVNEKGERVFMDDAAREKEIAGLNGKLRTCQ